MKIVGFENGSLAAEAGLQIGDDLIKINGHSIGDELDFQFHASDESLEIEVLRNGERLVFQLEKEYDDSLGIVFEETKFRCCGNHCIFCFVDQNPPGLRPSLYVKDEDFRLSFMYGNYVTLTNVSRSDLKRIVAQRLSPLYVSVHSTDLRIRKLMLGIQKDDHLLDKIRYLTEHRIELHAQIVLCPGINDGSSLRQTIHDLAGFYPQVKSIAIVPVGLTRYRHGLYRLVLVTPAFARSLIGELDQISEQFKRTWDDYFVYLADEFYLLAGEPLPASERYEDFPQLENGVGMARDFIDRFEEQSQQFPHRISTRKELTLVTGVLAAPIMADTVLPRFNRIENLQAKLSVIQNEFYGASVTVTGLLTGQDIYHQLRDAALGDVIVLPANCVNYDGLFLDGWTPELLQQRLQRPVQLIDTDFMALFENVE